ncbi:MAG: multidrug effflux MFS transporter [Geminicoccaceae bacterium]
MHGTVDHGAHLRGPRLIALLIVATALGPFAMQLFLPGLPAIQDEFQVSGTVAQLAFSLSAFAIAVATLAYGPLSDSLGRRPALVGGLAVYLAGSLLCALAPSITLLILGRIVQAAGGCAGIVLARAIVRDLWQRDHAASVLAYVSMAMVVAPMLAPLLGGLLTDTLGWRSIFVLGALVGVGILAFTLIDLRETVAERTGSSVAAMLGSFAKLLRSKAFVAYTLQGACSMAVFYTFLAGAPFVMIKVLGRSTAEYGLWFMSIAGAYMVGNMVTARLGRRIGIDRMIVLGSIGSLLANIVLLALLGIGFWTPAVLFGTTAFGAFAQGLGLPNVQAASLSVYPSIAGAASGLTGFVQMGIAAAAAQVVGSIQTGTPWPVAIGMSIFALAAFVWALLAARHGAGVH